MSLAEKIKAQTAGIKAETPIKEVVAEVKPEVEVPPAEIIADAELTPAEVESRTRESLADEVKALREENAKRRKKEQTAKEKALAAAEEIFKAERSDFESSLAEMKNELKALRDLKSEEIKVEEDVKAVQASAEMDILRKEMEALRAESNAAKDLIKEREVKEEDERLLRKQAAENRLKSLLTEIPEEFQEDAQAMFRGYTDPSEGLLALSRAKTKGLFSKKTIEVVSRIPDTTNNTNIISSANQKTRMREALSKRRAGLTPGQKL